MTRECLENLRIEVNKLFMAGTAEENPQTRYENAEKTIAEAEDALSTVNDHPELLDLFEQLEASCKRAEKRKRDFEWVWVPKGLKIP